MNCPGCLALRNFPSFAFMISEHFPAPASLHTSCSPDTPCFAPAFHLHFCFLPFPLAPCSLLTPPAPSPLSAPLRITNDPSSHLNLDRSIRSLIYIHILPDSSSTSPSNASSQNRLLVHFNRQSLLLIIFVIVVIVSHRCFATTLRGINVFQFFPLVFSRAIFSFSYSDMKYIPSLTHLSLAVLPSTVVLVSLPSHHLLSHFNALQKWLTFIPLSHC